MCQFWHPTSLLNQFWHPTSLLNQFWHPTSLLKQFWHPTSLLNQFWRPTSLLKQFWQTSLLNQFWLPTSLLKQFWHPTSLLNQFWHPTSLLHQFWHPAFLLMKLVCCVGFLARQQSFKHVTAFEETVANVQKRTAQIFLHTLICPLNAFVLSHYTNMFYFHEKERTSSPWSHRHRNLERRPWAQASTSLGIRNMASCSAHCTCSPRWCQQNGRWKISWSTNPQSASKEELYNKADLSEKGRYTKWGGSTPPTLTKWWISVSFCARPHPVQRRDWKGDHSSSNNTTASINVDKCEGRDIYNLYHNCHDQVATLISAYVYIVRIAPYHGASSCAPTAAAALWTRTWSQV